MIKTLYPCYIRSFLQSIATQLELLSYDCLPWQENKHNTTDIMANGKSKSEEVSIE